MSLGQGIGELWEAVRDRVEVSGGDPVWQITAGSFETAMTYARERFHDPAVLARSDRDRLWPRVTLTVTTDPDLAASAPSIEELAAPPLPRQSSAADRELEPLPPSLEEIFAHQEEARAQRRRAAQHAS